MTSNANPTVPHGVCTRCGPEFDPVTPAQFLAPSGLCDDCCDDLYEETPCAYCAGEDHAMDVCPVMPAGWPG